MLETQENIRLCMRNVKKQHICIEYKFTVLVSVENHIIREMYRKR